jgi:hypothetical protein
MCLVFNKHSHKEIASYTDQFESVKMAIGRPEGYCKTADPGDCNKS